MESWSNPSSDKNHGRPSGHINDTPTQIKALVTIFDDIQRRVGNKDSESLRLLRQDCDDMQQFAMDYEKTVSSAHPTKAQIIQEITELLSQIVQRMKRWTKFGTSFTMFLVKKDIQRARNDIARARINFQARYGIDIPKIGQQNRVSGLKIRTPSTLHNKTSMDRRGLNPTLSRINSRSRRSSLSSPLRASPLQRLPSNMSIDVEQLSPSPLTRSKRKATDDDTQNKRQKLSAEPESPLSSMKKQPPEGAGGDLSESSPSFSPGVPTFVPRLPRVVSPDPSDDLITLHAKPRDPSAFGRNRVRKILGLDVKEFHEVYDELNIPETSERVQRGTARDIVGKVVVAVKRINIQRLNSTILDRFIKELNSTYERQHQNLFNNRHTFWNKNNLLVIMDHMENKISLKEIIDLESKRMDEQRIWGVLHGVTEALDHLHRASVPHGKPDSRHIFLSVKGIDSISLRLDWCSILADHDNLEHQVTHYDAQNDIQDLGVLALEMLNKSARGLSPKRSEVHKIISGLTPSPSPEMILFILRTLGVEGKPTRRVSAADLLKLPLLAGGILKFLIVPTINAIRALRRRE